MAVPERCPLQQLEVRKENFKAFCSLTSPQPKPVSTTLSALGYGRFHLQPCKLRLNQLTMPFSILLLPVSSESVGCRMIHGQKETGHRLHRLFLELTTIHW